MTHPGKLLIVTALGIMMTAQSPPVSAQTMIGGGTPVFPGSVMSSWQNQPMTVNNANGTTSTTTYNPNYGNRGGFNNSVGVGTLPSYQSQVGQSSIGGAGTATGYPYSSILGGNRLPAGQQGFQDGNAQSGPETGAPAAVPAQSVPGSVTSAVPDTGVATGATPGAAPKPPGAPGATPGAPQALSTPVSPYAAPPGTRIAGRATALSGDTLQVDGTVVNLHGVTAPSITDLCSSGLTRWKCGMASMAALESLVRRGPINCLSLAEAGNRVVASCRLGRDDLSKAMVATGLVTPTDTDLIPTLREAQKDNRGLWAGGNP